jgi:hypothetical protein
VVLQFGVDGVVFVGVFPGEVGFLFQTVAVIVDGPFLWEFDVGKFLLEQSADKQVEFASAIEGGGAAEGPDHCEDVDVFD